MLGNKGQGAMEYLMTYGWAILVVMIVGIVMWQLGIFNMGSTTTTASGFSKIKPQLAAIALGADGVFQGVFTNGAGTRIGITTTGIHLVEASGSSADATLVDGWVNGFVAAGDNFQITAAALGQGQAGDVYDMEVVLDYTVTIGGITTTHTETGRLRGPRQ